jgi:hypothetical protein
MALLIWESPKSQALDGLVLEIGLSRGDVDDLFALKHTGDGCVVKITLPGRDHHRRHTVADQIAEYARHPDEPVGPL